MVKIVIGSILSIILISGCAVVPVKDKWHVNKCSISSDKKTLKVEDLSTGAIHIYEVEGLMLTPITAPISAIISGTYVLVNNIYNIGEEKLKCGED